MNIYSLCQERGAEILVGDRCHIQIYEQGGVAQLGGVHPRTLHNRSARRGSWVGG